MESINLRELQKISYYDVDIQYKFGQLGYLLGKRAMIASEILSNKQKDYKNPEEYRLLMIDAYNHIEREIKQMLFLDAIKQ